ncbi:hap1 transcriptional regulatory prottein [Scheffersomyces spartinae]|uniref:Hap1 transcriptional regulatory prottein n=1 Tax=Scheffersomyces spartinae TaxID=45513 RepID=A0A9P7VBV1_9ASCO|nr:hap1 transcriptional regulatory prottein [Scheffersomyces spartinae]KAG7194860.1 hap1 transcriptional regulatory prottein [Scheffersomyces spartinae]
MDQLPPLITDRPLPSHRSSVTSNSISSASSSSSSNASLNSSSSLSSYGSSYLAPSNTSNNNTNAGSKKQLPTTYTTNTFSVINKPSLSDPSPVLGLKLAKRKLREEQTEDDVLRTELESLKNKLRRIESKLHIDPPPTPSTTGAGAIVGVVPTSTTTNTSSTTSSVPGPLHSTTSLSPVDIKCIQRYEPFQTTGFPAPLIPSMYSPTQKQQQRQSSVRNLPLPNPQASSSIISMMGSNVTASTSHTSPDIQTGDHEVLTEVNKFFLLVGNNPYESPLDIIDFISGYSSLLRSVPTLKISAGPLSWMGLLGSDKALRAVCQFVQASKAILAEKHQALSEVQELEQQFAQKAKEEAGLCVDPLFVKENSKEPKVVGGVIGDVRNHHNPVPLAMTSVSKSNINRKAREMGLTFYEGELDEEMKLVEKIQLVLPRKDVIWRLIKRYFKHLYPYMPFIDEISFRGQCESFIGKEDLNDKLEVTNLLIERKSDFAFLGLLLIVLRFSYLTVFTSSSCINPAHLKSDDLSPEAEEKMIFLSNPINIEVIDVAQLCLNQFNLMRNGYFPVLQLALFTRLYHEYAPEDGDAAQVFTAMLIQMAFGLGLHREPHPSTVKNSVSERYNNLRRKIWHHLLMDDLVGAMNSGTPMTTNPNSFDTKLPAFSPEASNCLDLELEKVTLSGLRHCHETYVPTVELVGLLSNIRGGVSVKALTENLNYLEREVISKYGRLGGFFEEANAEELSYSTIKMTIYFTSTIFLVSVFVYIFNFYESKSRADLVYFYSRKIFIIVYQDFLPHFKYFIDNSARIFKDSTDIIVTPGFELAAHKSLMVNYMFLIRISLRRTKIRNAIQDGIISSDKHIEKHLNSLGKLLDLLEQALDILIESLAMISHRYYYAWKVSKVQKVLRKLCVNQEFIDQFSETNKETDALLFSNSQIEELTGIVERSLEKISKQKRPRRQQHQHQQLQQLQQKQKQQLHNHHANSMAKVEENGSMNSDIPPISADYPSSHSMGSTDSCSDINTVQGLSAEQIDLMWYQVLALKNDKDGGAPNINESYNIGGILAGNRPAYKSTNPMSPEYNNMDPSSNMNGLKGVQEPGNNSSNPFLTLNQFYDVNFEELLEFFDDSVMQNNVLDETTFTPVQN